MGNLVGVCIVLSSTQLSYSAQPTVLGFFVTVGNGCAPVRVLPHRGSHCGVSLFGCAICSASGGTDSFFFAVFHCETLARSERNAYTNTLTRTYEEERGLKLSTHPWRWGELKRQNALAEGGHR